MTVYLCEIVADYSQEVQEFVGVYSTAELAREAGQREMRDVNWPYPVSTVVTEMEVDK